MVLDSAPAVPLYTGEEWLSHVGYTSLRLLTCLDLENKLRAFNLVSPKMSATRQWLDGITVAYASNSAPRNVWPVEPYTFDEVVQEALSLLQVT